jgi:hypothetical protein
LNQKVLFATLLLALVAGFSSCKKDKGNENENNLAGTTWVLTSNVWWDQVMIFKTNTTGEVQSDWKGEGPNDTETFTYTYEHPKITIVNVEGYEIKGTIEGNKMTLIDEEADEDKKILTYEKQ